MSLSIDDLREMYTDAKHKNKKLKQEVERLGNELRSARNDNELTRSVGDRVQSSQCDEESKRELQSKLNAANSSIDQIQHSKKELDQELRTERRRNAELQASLEQAQDAKAELEHSLKRLQDALDDADRSRALGHAERSDELEKRLAEKEQSLQAQEKRLQEKEQRLQAQERSIREQQSNLPATKPAAVKRRTGRASEEVASMLAPGAKTHTGLQNRESRSGAVGPIKKEPLAQPNFKLNPGAIAFRPTDSKSMAQEAVRPPPSVVSRPYERDVTMDFVASFLAKAKAKEAAKADEPRPPVVSQFEEEDDTMEFIRSVNAKRKAEAAKAEAAKAEAAKAEAAKADAVAKSKIPANKEIKDAAAGTTVEPGRPKDSDTPPQDVITKKRKFEEDDMFSAQQSGPTRPKLA